MQGVGPPYPRYAPGAAPGGNAIGAFIIGKSPIGDVAAFDPWATILAQYSNSQRIDDLINSFNAALDPTQSLDSFYDLIWNVDTAQGNGLDIWGRIVGVARTVQIPSLGASFGFQEAGGSWTGFNQAPFASGALGTTISLLDADFRRLIMAKAATNVTDCSIPSINAILLALFPKRGNCFVVDLIGPDANTVLLLHNDGNNGSTTFLDASLNHFPMAANAGGVISTAQSKFGGASGAFFGTNDSVITPDAVGLTPSGDYTIDFWAFPTALVGGTFYGALHKGFNGPYWFYIDSAGGWRFFASSTGVSWDIAANVSIGAASVSTWQHIAVSRSGNTYRLFNNGVQQSTFSNSSTPFQNTSPFEVGNTGGTPFQGYIDEARFSNVARWTAGFSPPSTPYPQTAQGMAMQYKFNFGLTAQELAIVLTSGVLPRPAGVAAAVVHL